MSDQRNDGTFRCLGNVTCNKMCRHVLSSSLSCYKLAAVCSPCLEVAPIREDPDQSGLKEGGQQETMGTDACRFERIHV